MLEPKVAVDALVGDVLDQVVDALAVDALVLELRVPVPTGEAPTRRHPEASGEPIDVRLVNWSTGWTSAVAYCLYRWDEVATSTWLHGPVLVEERDTTHAVAPGWRFSIDEFGDALWEAS